MKHSPLLVLLSLFAQTAYQSLPYTQVFYPTSALVSGVSTPVQASSAFSECLCDLTKGGCDFACCCDPDCDAATTSAWMLKKTFCKNEQYDQTILTAAQCFDRTFQSSIGDLQAGLSVYDKNIRGLFCIASSSSRQTISSFVSSQFTANTPQEFNSTIDTYSTTAVQERISVLQNQIKTATNEKAIGYTALEPLVGFKLVSPTSVYNADSSITLARTGLFGQCNPGRPIKFMKDLPTQECGIQPQVMSQTFCEQTMSPIRQALNLQISKDGTLTNILSLTPGIQKSFKLNEDYSENTFTATQFQDSVYDGSSGKCSCSNLLKEVHYIVYFAEQAPDNRLAFSITNITTDVVYGDYSPTSCSDQVYLTIKTSLQFKQSLYARKNSGGPGYVKGNPILTGSAVDIVNGTYIKEQSEGFQLRGGDNSGICYNIKTSLSTGLNATQFRITDINQQLYFDDPQLLFQDTTLYGCRVQLTRDELKTFCTTKQWQNLVIFQNLQTLKYIGSFGNANPHNINDWIEVTLNTQKDKQDITVDWVEQTGTCSIPSSYFLQIFYSKINTRSNPQYQIIKAQHYSDTLYSWQFNKVDPSEKQDFLNFLSVQFYEVDQDANLFVPKTPNAFTPLPRNILYPFYVYGSASSLVVGLASLLCIVSALM